MQQKKIWTRRNPHMAKKIMVETSKKFKKENQRFFKMAVQDHYICTIKCISCLTYVELLPWFLWKLCQFTEDLKGAVGKTWHFENYFEYCKV